MTAINRRPSSRMIVIRAALLALLALLGWRRAVQAAAVRPRASRRRRWSLGGDATLKPTAAVTDNTIVRAASADVTQSGFAGTDELPVGAAGTARRATLLRMMSRRALAAAALAAVGIAGLFAAGSVSAMHSADSLLGLASSHSAAADPVIAVAGDSCGDPTSCAPTASVIDQINPDALLTLGDNAYEDGTLAEYNSYYKPNWGRNDAKVYPAPGNHDFHTANAQGYRDYFGVRAPALYYSYDLGAWHLISLPGDDPMDASAGSAQEVFLRNDLTAHASQCTLVYWHEPRWSSGSVHGNDSNESAIWNDLYNAGVDVVLNGHDHNYQRFGHLSKNGTPDPAGPREFVVGTGGWGHYGFTSSTPQPEVRNDTDYGVMKMTLHAGSYAWQFVSAGGTFTDAGSDTCSGASPPPTTTTSTSPSTSTSTSTSATTSSSSTGTTTTTPTTTTTSIGGNVPPERFMFFTGLDARPAASGFNLYDVNSKSDADLLPTGAQALAFLGVNAGWDDATCSWDLTGSQITTMVNNTKDDPKVYGYFFSDEPNPFLCRNAVQAHRDRVALIRSLTTKPTVMVLDSNRGQETLDQVPLWVGVADYVNLDIYPCYQGQACRFDYERQVIAAADAAGLVYWGGVQAFNDSEFRWPTVGELQTQLNIWSASHWHGMMLFAFSWGGGNLYNHPDLVSVLQSFNLGSPPPTTTTTTSTTTPTTTTAADTVPPTTPTHLRVTLGTQTSLTLSWDASTDNVGVIGYRVWRNGNLLSLQPGTSRTQVSLICSTAYKYEVAAFDAAGNVSPRASYTAVCGFH